MTLRAHTEKLLLVALLCSTSAAAWACSKERKATLPKDDVVVARVNGTAVTRYEVENTGKRSLGGLSAALTPAAYAKLRQAAIQNRAIALAAEAELNETEKKALEKEVAVYREQLLVRRYLSKHAPPKPVTPAMISDYYKNHPERFGGGKELGYELLGTTRVLAGAERDRVLSVLRDAASKPDWKAFGDELEKGGYPLTFSTTSSQDKLLHPKLRELFRQLEAGKTSTVTFVEGRAYVARAKGESQRPPKPFEDVKDEIERLLTPAQLSDAVEKAAAEVMKTAEVEVLEGAPGAVGSAPKPRGSGP